MGMDVYGENPKIHTPQPQRPETEDYNSDELQQYFSDRRKWEEENVGSYFRNNVWWWRPLWVYVAELCDDILTEEDIENGHNNSGHLIDQEKCLIIAKRLVDELRSGRVAKYKEARDRHLEGLAEEDCNLCDSTGIRNDEYVQGECNGCHGTGKKPHWDTHYPFDEENVEEFKNFVKESGGFRIN